MKNHIHIKIKKLIAPPFNLKMMALKIINKIKK